MHLTRFCSGLLAAAVVLPSLALARPAQAQFHDECQYSDYRTRYDSYGRPYYEECNRDSTLTQALKLGGALIVIGVLDEVLSSDSDPAPRHVRYEPEYRQQPVYYPPTQPQYDYRTQPDTTPCHWEQGICYKPVRY